jgi:heat shock protein HslJ
MRSPVAKMLVLAAACPMAAAAVDGTSWLDRTGANGWNVPGASIPAAPVAQESVDARCVSLARPAQLPEDKLVRERGWHLQGPYQGGWDIVVIRGTAGYDSMCRPVKYQDFVFVSGTFAGTLSPQAMTSRTDGSLIRASVMNDRQIKAEFARYATDDALCCPSRTSSVVFGITGETPLMQPLAVSTASPEPANARLRGLYTYMADAGWFTECSSHERFPVAQAGDNAALEAAYTATRPESGKPMLATVEGRIEIQQWMEGPPRPTLLVERFVGIEPSQGCEFASAETTLEETHWKLVQLGSSRLEAVESKRAPHLILRPADGRASGFAGCNRFTGTYVVKEDELTFDDLAGTMMACVDGMEQERAFHEALQKVRRWSIEGELLRLFDVTGAVVAQFEAMTP